MDRQAKYQQGRKDQRRKSSLDMGSMVYGKVPPQAKDLEEAIIGGILLDKNAFDLAVAILKPECFYVEAHQRIFSAMQSLTNKSQPIDSLTVAEELRGKEELETVGGAYYIMKTTNTVVSSANIETHCRIVMQKYIQREIIRVCGELIGDAYEDGADSLELLDYAEEQLSLVTDSMSFGDMTPIDKVLVNAISRIEQWRQIDMDKHNGIALTGIPSGVKELDMCTRGWQNGDLIIIAARPSVGKTAFALNILRKAASYLTEYKLGCVAMWSLEMKAVRLILRMLASSSEIWLSKIQTGRLQDHEMKQIYAKGIQVLSNLGVFFDDHSGLTIQKLRSKARKLKRKNKLKLIIIDYLQLMTPEERSGNREQEVSKISRNLKNLAQELDIPIIALSQLSREVEKRTGGIPQLSDLRESGSLEQDADVVIFLYGPSESEVNENISLRGRRYIKVAKQRDGMLDTIEIDFKDDIQLFEAVGRVSLPSGLGPSWKPYKEESDPKLYIETGSKLIDPDGKEGEPF